ncbi:MAG: formate dehydrogenase subunit delta [Pseudomonadota bacterium]|jgi:formate dehydrogenase subunit delta
MSAHQRRNLVMMANQIAIAFDGQRGDAVGQTVAHIKAFWPRPMREDILRHLSAGGEGLTPTARAAVARLAPTPRT